MAHGPGGHLVILVAVENRVATGETGTAAWTEDDDTLAAVGASTHVGAAAWTEDDDVLVASGDAGAGHTGPAAWTEADDVLAAVGTATHVGTSSWTEADDACAAAGRLTRLGTSSWTEADDTTAGAGTPTRIGTAAWTEADDVLAGFGAVGAGLFVTAVSGNSRYLVDQLGDPIFVQGNSPQLMVGMYTPTNVATLFTDQATRGINAAQIHSIVNQNIGANTGSVNYNGDPPFTNMSTLSGTSAATDRYWAFVDSIFDAAESVGCTIFFGVIDNISHSATVAALSDAQATAFGTFIGTRYKTRPNLVWVIGNDWQSGQWSATEAKYRKIIDGIRAAGDTHLLTVWLDYTDSFSTEISSRGGYTAWLPLIDIEAVYSYTLPYYQAEQARAVTGTHAPRPVLGFEWNYEGVHYHSEFGQASTTRLTVRRDAWWAVTAGCCGQFFGQDAIIPANTGLDLSAGVLGSGYATDNQVIVDVMTAHDRWQDLVPDTGSAFVTAGRGTHSTAENVDPLDNNYVTAAITADGMLAVVYLSNWASSGTTTIDVAGKISGTATITRIDPTNGATTSDSAPFTTPGNNAAGNTDWVLVFEGTEVISGTASWTEDNDTLAAAGASTHVGTSATTEANDTLAAAGQSTHVGVAAWTESDDVFTASGASHTQSGTAAWTEADDSASGAGASTHLGVAAWTEADDTLAGIGQTGNDIGGPATWTEADDTCAGAGVVTHLGASSWTETDDICAGIGTSTHVGTATWTETDDALLAIGGSTAAGTATWVEETDLLLAVGTPTRVGTAAWTEDDDQLLAVDFVLAIQPIRIQAIEISRIYGQESSGRIIGRDRQ